VGPFCESVEPSTQEALSRPVELRVSGRIALPKRQAMTDDSPHGLLELVSAVNYCPAVQWRSMSLAGLNVLMVDDSYSKRLAVVPGATLLIAVTTSAKRAGTATRY